MIGELESRAAVATTALTSSFLPKCTQLLQVKVAHCPPSRVSFHGAVASTKQKKKGRKSPTRDWAYEHFMVLWDEVFEQCCTDPVKATQIRHLSRKGLKKHGRGCVLVYQEVQTRPRGAGTGFTSKPPKSSRRVPEFVTLDYHAVYLPREFLLDPRKAPSDEDMAGSEDKEQPESNSARVVVEKQGDDINKISDIADRQQYDNKRGTDVSAGRVIDIEEIIGEAQDVYSFYSDDEEDSGDAADDNDSLLDSDEKEGDTNTTGKDDTEGAINALKSLIILEDDIDKDNHVGLNVKIDESTFNANGRDAKDNVDESFLNASENFHRHESPFQSFDNDSQAEPHVIDSLSTDTQHEVDLVAITEPVVVDDTAQLEHNSKNVVQRTQLKEGPTDNPDFDIKSYSTSKLRESILLDDNVSRMEDIDVSTTASLLEEGNRRTKMQVENNGGTHANFDESGSVTTSGPIVELLDESHEADTSESHGLLVIEKVNQNQVNEDIEDEKIQLVTQQMLYACMRGMDRTRVMSLTANFDFEADKFKFRRKMAVIDVKTADAGGEDPYNPDEEEVILLLHLRIDGKPAYGADVVIAHKDETQPFGVEDHYWKLQGKYRNIFC